MISTLPIILLAAGASSRMRGRDKLLETVDGQPLIARQARLARKVTSGLVLVALPPRPHKRATAIADIDVTPHEIHDAATGMTASIRSCIAALPPETPAAMLMLADMPALTEKDLKSVLQAVDINSKKRIWRATSATGKPGHPIVFSATVFHDLKALTGDRGAQAIVSANSDRTALIPLPENNATLDLDTPEDWADWRKART